MLNRRQFLLRTLKGSSLIALGSAVPQFLASTARAAEAGKDTVLVVLEMTGGNDGLNTVVPYADDNYHRVRPTLRLTKEQVVRVNDQVGLNPGMRSFERLLQKSELAVVQGVGYPNPDRSHFESMDIWQSADPKRKTANGWLGRSLGSVHVGAGHIPGMYVGKEKLPLAMRGSATGVPTIHPSKPYELELARQLPGQEMNAYNRAFVRLTVAGEGDSSGPALGKHARDRKQLIEDVAKLSPAPPNSMLQFVQRSSLQHIMEQDLRNGNRGFVGPNAELGRDLNLIAQMISADFGTRVYYVSVGGFDTHANQAQQHQQLLQQVADGITNFFTQLEGRGHGKRVIVMTFSEFGRRVDENGSKGTDHGAASCLFVAGPAVQGGVVGKHPSLAKEDLLEGDLKHGIDFRQVYATLLDGWLGCDSEQVLAGKFPHVPLLKKA
jgi:uncharacterized protein (DUF1501 family)